MVFLFFYAIGFTNAIARDRFFRYDQDMENGLSDRITRINNELADFAASWIEIFRGNQKPVVKREQLAKILDPGMDLINRGGKRWRPLLMQLCCEMAGGGDRALPFTPVVEIAHNGTLIADDIEDNSEMRRGEKTIHLKYGLDMALNTGNFMCFLPSLIIEKSTLLLEQKLQVFKYYLEDLRNLHIGQGLDIQWHNDYDYMPSQEEYFYMCSLKTGTLARMAARLGILIGCGSEKLANQTGLICENFGVGFQIIDDVKNLTTGNPGKKTGDDIIEGKKSLPVILYSQKPGARTGDIIEIFKAFSNKRAAHPDTAITEVIKLLTESGSIREAGDIAFRMINSAIKEIQMQFPASEALSLLLNLFSGLYS